MHDLPAPHDPRRMPQYHRRRGDAMSAHSSSTQGQSAAHEVRAASVPGQGIGYVLTDLSVGKLRWLVSLAWDF